MAGKRAMWVWIIFKLFGTIPSSKPGFLYSVFIIFSSSIFYFSSKYNYFTGRGNIKWYTSFYTFRGVLEVLVAITHIISLWKNSKRFNVLLKELNGTARYQLLSAVIILWQVLSALYYVCFTSGFDKGYWKLLVTLILIDIVAELILAQFFILCVTLANKISHLHDSNQFPIAMCSNVLKVMKDIQFVGKLFQMQQFFIGFRLLFNLFYFSNHARKEIQFFGSEEFSWLFVGDRLNYTLWQIFLIWAFTWPVEVTMRKVTKFHKHLFDVIQRNPELWRDARLSLYVLVKPSVTFTACGFFEIGYPFMTSVITAAVSYLVFLIQMDIEG